MTQRPWKGATNSYEFAELAHTALGHGLNPDGACGTAHHFLGLIEEGRRDLSQLTVILFSSVR